MKRKNYILVIISILFLLVIAGCGNKKADLSNVKESSGNIVIKGHNFRGLHQGNGTVKDPDYKYSIYFSKDGNFVQDIISSKGFAGRFTEKGTYNISKNGDVTMNIASVTEERFNSDSALLKGYTPTSIVQREDNTLNDAENHPIKIENKKTYLLGTVNNVKLYPTDAKTVNYKEHYQDEMKKYDNTYNKFSGHGFTSNGMDTSMNGIAFKGNSFIWRYGYLGKNTDKDNAVMTVFEGTYSYSSNNHILTLNVSNQSKAYYGNLMNLNDFKYMKSDNSLAVNRLKLKYRNNVLTLVDSSLKGWKMKDAYPDDTSRSQLKYDDYLNSYSVSIFDSKMQKDSDDNSSVKKVFPTKEDFADWVTDYYQDDEDTENFHVLEAGDGATLPIQENTGGIKKDTPMVYRLYYSLAEEGNDESDVGRNVGITSDGKIYSGHDIMFDPDLTQAYKDYINN
ncbi:hypothetical protein [Companilactobacillus keshanensis]|uniref:Lipoprotein n=1 Tax=Companilactobacillus keshanensis TaxID=2486003 RepID=A0ABW4BUZ4_9LACO|nr:hypothetical protein [Companilactobacillus keshanensis]